VSGAIHPAPASEADLILHLRANRYDFLHEFAHKAVTEFAEWLEVVESVHCFDYHEGRDLIGFLEGSGNPAEPERAAVALVGDEDPDWAGGSYLHVQRYVHNLEQWERLPVRQQETVIGRTKIEGAPIAQEDRAKTAHLSRIAVTDHGQAMRILRQSMPYGSPGGEQGAMFCCYCRTPLHFERMLTRMIAPTSDGRVDLLLNFTRAVTGGAFFVPSVKKLKELVRPQ
jgi:putative iron-dependent peroxidase